MWCVWWGVGVCMCARHVNIDAHEARKGLVSAVDVSHLMWVWELDSGVLTH